MTQSTANDPSRPDTAPDADDGRTPAEDAAATVGADDTLHFDEAAPGAAAEAEAGAGAGDGAVDLDARCAELEAEVDKLRRDYLGALAEAQNAKRMADKRIQDNTKYAVSNLAKAVLPVADNLERATAAAPEEARNADPNLKNLAVGVEMTARELLTALGQYGVKRIEALNQPFDPNLHQAMQEMENPDVPAGTVVQVYQEGYVIHDRLLRPAMVVVSKGGPKRQPAAPADAQAAPEAQGVDTSA
ncbi:nucleotide exchange factor GrpE [Roseospira navarrensis]|uniref:Protein GrpE n=1 Tax=Roseospira navarrensis TaxID=140058 RepID=A0A7X2D419_9PROT|nr:nucleotide exchange factor GrpE [Roseospira navarrensis]MQX37463.1 nucleotide exchange factor GrpE [Roseospira navarrensis]